MGDQVTTKRSSRVSFIGVSNLPHDKAIQLRDILQSIITHLSSLHSTCNDARITIDDRCKEVKNLGSLQGDLDTLVSIAQVQVDVCDHTNGQVLQELKSIYAQIADNVVAIRSLLMNLSAHSTTDAYHIVERLLTILRLTVELLRGADRYTVKHIEQSADNIKTLADAVATSTSMQMLLDRAAPLSRAAVEVVRIAEQRARALDQNSEHVLIRDMLRDAGKKIGEYVPAIILSTKESIATTKRSNPPIDPLKCALSDIAHAARVSPEFSVLFDVDYVDSLLGLKLQTLTDAVREKDRIQTATAAKAVHKELDRRIALAKKDPKPKQEEMIKAIQAANQQAQAAANEALNARLMGPEPLVGVVMAADQKMMNMFKNLKLVAKELPDASVASVNSQIPLIQAAKALSLQLWSLLQ